MRYFWIGLSVFFAVSTIIGSFYRGQWDSVSAVWSVACYAMYAIGKLEYKLNKINEIVSKSVR